jgi:hypothetical protein
MRSSGPQHVAPSIFLTEVCHDRWEEAWELTGQQRMQERISRQEIRRAQALHHLQLLILRIALLASPLRPKPAPPKPVLASSAPPGSPRPAPNHPWCRPLLAKQ